MKVAVCKVTQKKQVTTYKRGGKQAKQTKNHSLSSIGLVLLLSPTSFSFSFFFFFPLSFFFSVFLRAYAHIFQKRVRINKENFFFDSFLQNGSYWLSPIFVHIQHTHAKQGIISLFPIPKCVFPSLSLSLLTKFPLGFPFMLVPKA